MHTQVRGQDLPCMKVLSGQAWSTVWGLWCMHRSYRLYRLGLTEWASRRWAELWGQSGSPEENAPYHIAHHFDVFQIVIMYRSYRLEAHSIGLDEMGRVVGTTWKSMSPQEKAPYERVATEELERYMDAKRTFEALHRHYSTLHYGAQEAGKGHLYSAFCHVSLVPGLQSSTLPCSSHPAKLSFEALHHHYSTLHYGAQEAGEGHLCSVSYSVM